ncbi:MAG: Polysaccharide lyase, family, partial [Pedosphaera sp.]|nr:Polysaccharide lyase, family [Pedosphaera sp.]
MKTISHLKKKRWLTRVLGVVTDLAIALGCLSALAVQTQFYVATNGVDTNAGTLAQPFLTISKAASVMVAGDTCFIRGGTYRETVTPASSGSAGAP